MATKKKAEWIEAICKLDDENKGLLGEIPQKELEDFTVGQLKSLFKEMEADLEAEKTPEPKDTGSTELVVADGNEEGKFASMCGSEFNPKKTGECHKQCSVDFPEAFEACTEQYKSLESVGKVKTTPSKPTAGKTAWGHTNGKQGGLIDDFFFNGEVGTLADIAKFANGKEQRCMHHMKHLVFDLGIVIKYNFDKVVEKVDDKEVTKQIKKYWWADKDKRRKGDKLEGKSAYPSIVNTNK